MGSAPVRRASPARRGHRFLFRKKAVGKNGPGDGSPGAPSSTPQRAGLKSLRLQRSVVPKAMAFAYEVPGEPGSKLGTLSRRQSKLETTKSARPKPLVSGGKLPRMWVRTPQTLVCRCRRGCTEGEVRRGKRPRSPSGVFFPPSFFWKRKRGSRRTGALPPPGRLNYGSSFNSKRFL